MDLSRIGKYFFVLYIYNLAWELIGLIFVEWYNFDTFERRTKEFCLWGEEDWKGMSPRISFLTKFWIYFESMKRIWTNLIFGKIVIGFERIENDPINYLNSKTLKRPRYRYESDFRQKYSMKIISRNTFEVFSNTKHVLLLLRCTMFSSNPSLVTIPVSSKFRHGNYFTRGTRHARRKCHFEKYLVTKYEKWFPRCVRLSISHIRPKNPATRYPQLTPRIQFRRESVRCRTGRQYLRHRFLVVVVAGIAAKLKARFVQRRL